MKLDDYIVEIDIDLYTYQFIEPSYNSIWFRAKQKVAWLEQFRPVDHETVATLWLGGNCLCFISLSDIRLHSISYQIKLNGLNKENDFKSLLANKYKQLLIDDIMSKDFKGV